MNILYTKSRKDIEIRAMFGIYIYGVDCSVKAFVIMN